MSTPHAPVPTEPPFNPEDPGTPVPIRGSEDASTWFTRHVKGIVIGLYATAALLVLLDLAYAKHPHVQGERLFGFYGFYGFVGCVSLVLLAKLLRVFVKRPEDYYER